MRVTAIVSVSLWFILYAIPALKRWNDYRVGYRAWEQEATKALATTDSLERSVADQTRKPQGNFDQDQVEIESGLIHNSRIEYLQATESARQYHDAMWRPWKEHPELPGLPRSRNFH
jgi:hypothetical protein